MLRDVKLVREEYLALVRILSKCQLLYVKKWAFLLGRLLVSLKSECVPSQDLKLSFSRVLDPVLMVPTVLHFPWLLHLIFENEELFVWWWFSGIKFTLVRFNYSWTKTKNRSHWSCHCRNIISSAEWLNSGAFFVCGSACGLTRYFTVADSLWWPSKGRNIHLVWNTLMSYMEGRSAAGLTSYCKIHCVL